MTAPAVAASSRNANFGPAGLVIYFCDAEAVTPDESIGSGVADLLPVRGNREFASRDDDLEQVIRHIEIREAEERASNRIQPPPTETETV